MSNGTCYAPECAQPACIDTGLGGVRLNVEVAHIYGVKPNAPRFRADLTDEERDDWRHLLLLCEAHHRAIDDPKTGADNYPAEMLLQWKAAREAALGVGMPPVTLDQLELLLARFFEDPSERLATLVGRLDDIAKEAARTGQINGDTVQELRLVVTMLKETDSYRLAESARTLSEAAEIYSAMNLGSTAKGLSEAAEIFGNLNLAQRARELRAAAEQLNFGR